MSEPKFGAKDLYTSTNSSVLTKLSGGTKMATFTVSIPDGLKKRLDEHPDINWAEYLKERFAVRLKQFKKFQELVNRGEI